MSQDIHFSEKLACSSLWDSQVHETNTRWNLEIENAPTQNAYIIACLTLTRYLCTQATEHSIISSYVLNQFLPLDGRSTT